MQKNHAKTTRPINRFSIQSSITKLICGVMMLLLLSFTTIEEQPTSFNNTSTATDAENAMDINFLCYNVQMFGGTLANTVWKKSSNNDGARRKEIAKRILGLSPDVVGLTEVWSDGAKKDFIKLLKSKYDQYYFKSYTSSNDVFTGAYREVASKKQIGSGLIIFAKKGYKIFNPGFVPFKNLSGYDKKSEKGVIAVSISKPGKGFFRVFLSHLQAGSSGSSKSNRMKNVKQLVDFTKLYSTNAACVVMGDINIDANEGGRAGQGSEYKNILMSNDAFGQHYNDTYYQKNPRSTQRTAGTGKKRLDYILSKKGNITLDAKVITNWTYSSKRKPCSDHLPISARLRLNALPEAASVSLKTGDRKYGGSDAKVEIKLKGRSGEGVWSNCNKANYNDRVRGKMDTYGADASFSGGIKSITVKKYKKSGDKQGWNFAGANVTYNGVTYTTGRKNDWLRGGDVKTYTLRRGKI